MNVEIWQIVLWCLGTVGIAGTIAAIVLYPAVVSLVFRMIVKFFTFVLGYRIGCAIVAAVAMGFAVDYWRHSTDDAEFAQRTALFEHAQKDRDERIATETREVVWTEIANQTAANAVTDKLVEEFHDALPPVLHADSSPFRVGPAASKLRVIAGQAERRSGRIKRVPAARSKGRS